MHDKLPLKTVLKKMFIIVIVKLVNCGVLTFFLDRNCGVLT